MPGLRVNEVFLSLQGEGCRSGTPAVFVRLQGCGVRCPWCDTGYALSADRAARLPDESPLVLAKEGSDPRWTLAGEEWLTAGVLAMAGPVRRVVLTGGEPFEQEIVPFLRGLVRAGFSAQIETSGTRPMPLPGEIRKSLWITLSPKRAKPPLPENWALADEIKIPVAAEEDFTFFEPFLPALPKDRVCLQPLSLSPEATRICVELCLARDCRLSLQTHRILDLR